MRMSHDFVSRSMIKRKDLEGFKYKNIGAFQNKKSVSPFLKRYLLLEFLNKNKKKKEERKGGEKKERKEKKGNDFVVLDFEGDCP